MKRGQVRVPTSAAQLRAVRVWLIRRARAPGPAPTLLTSLDAHDLPGVGHLRDLRALLRHKGQWARQHVELPRELAQHCGLMLDACVVTRALPPPEVLAFLQACRLAGAATRGRPRLTVDQAHRALRVAGQAGDDRQSRRRRASLMREERLSAMLAAGGTLLTGDW